MEKRKRVYIEGAPGTFHARARELNTLELMALSHRPGVKGIAVENFLNTVDLDMEKADHLANLEADVRRYGWNVATVKAIRDGLEQMYR